MLTFAEVTIRAEASLRFSSPGNAQTFFKKVFGFNMVSAGVAVADIAAYCYK
jgi:hypothetical protein